VSAGDPARVRALSFHARYRCGHSGACCSSGWTIPVEPEVAARIDAGVASDRVRGWDGSALGGWARPIPEAGRAPLPAARVALRTLPGGACVFFDARATRLCAVHLRLGEGALPSSCRHFPRVVTLTPLGISVALSHYCPTAAGLLVAAPAEPARVVEAPPAFPPSWPFEGLDARAALPPSLRPGVLATWESFERWEEDAVATLTRSSSPEAALATLAARAERVRRWTPADGDFDAFFAARLAEGGVAPSGASSPAGLADWRLVASTAFAPGLLPAAPPPAEGRADEWLAAGWVELAPVIARWLAAKAFGSWLALHAEGLRTTVLGLRVALGVLRAEAARGCVDAGRPLDARLLLQALRRADLLLVHLADPEALAARLSRCETAC
jgi:Fe-S-cluster containining protein